MPIIFQGSYLTKNPKDNPPWISKRYRSFIRDGMQCLFCAQPLLEEKPGFVSHHAFHSGGKRARDSLLTSLCLACHNRLHANESRFNRQEAMTEEKWLAHCMGNLIEYVESLNINSRWVAINALRCVAEENE